MADAELVDKVATELERLLSKKNLAEDKQISSALNPQLYVPISTILTVVSLKELTTSADVVVAAAKKSDALGLDDAEQMVRPLLKSKRDTVILRDIPEDATEAELRGLVAGAPKAPAVLEVTKEVNQIWFVKFGTEEACQDVAWWLRSQKFRGEPVKVAIKSEHFLRSFFQAPAASALPAAGKGDIPSGKPSMMPAFGKNPGFWMPWAGGKGMADGPILGAPMPIVADQANLPANILDNVGRGRGGGAAFGKNASMDKGKGSKGTKGKGKGKRKDNDAEADAGLIRAMGDMNLGADSGGTEFTGPVTYEHEFRKYTQEEIKNLVAKMGAFSMPDALQDPEHESVVVKDREGWTPSPAEEKSAPPKEKSPKPAGGSPGKSPPKAAKGGGKGGHKWVEKQPS